MWYAEEGASISIKALQRTGEQRWCADRWSGQESVVDQPPPLSVSVDMICIANNRAKRTCKTRLLAQGLRKSSDLVICTQGKS
jgi:hypothetical protein